MGYFSAIYAKDLPHRAKPVYMYLKDRCNKDGLSSHRYHCQGTASVPQDGGAGHQRFALRRSAY